LGTGGTTAGGGICAAAPLTNNKKIAIAKQQERIMSLSTEQPADANLRTLRFGQ
jgi:hypothetical protein